MSTLLKKSVALFATAAILASTSVTAFAASKDEPEIPAENTDTVVWINGKDVKGSKDGSTPATLYKTETVTHRGMYTGGKWAVAVTPATVDDATFAGYFGDGAKMDGTAAKAGKEYASAKLKDGVITVTAGKKSGEIKVWVYEINNKKLVNEDDKNGIKPVSYTFTVKNASSGLVYTTKADDIKDGVLAKGEKAGKLGLKDGEKTQDAVVYYFADKKLANDGTLEIDVEGKNKFDEKVVTAEIEQDKKSGLWALTLTPVAAGKTNVVVKVKESGKSVKIAAEVVASYKITLDKNAPDVKVTANKETLEFTKSEAWVTTGTSITFDKDVQIGKDTIKAGKAYKVTGHITVEAVPAAE